MNRKKLWLWVDFALITLVWGVVAVMLVKVGPMFGEIFRDFGGALPWMTREVLLLSEIMVGWWPLVVFVAAFSLGVFQARRLREIAADIEPPRWERITVRSLIAIGAVTFMLLLVAFYIPIMSLGSDISGM